jgi:cystathionine beta-lyase/cystathionine gamma-synthase
VYGGTNRFFRNCANRMGIDTSFVDMTDLIGTEKSFKSNTAMCWIETPTNPTLKLVIIINFYLTFQKQFNRFL